MSTGIELQVLLPVVQAPFRVYWAYNPLMVREYLQPPIVADRSIFPNQATFLNAVASFGNAYPFFEQRSHVPLHHRPDVLRRGNRLQYVSIETNPRSFSLTKNCIFLPAIALGAALLAPGPDSGARARLRPRSGSSTSRTPSSAPRTGRRRPPI